MSLPSAFDAGVVAGLSALDAKSVKHVFFVACGGSLSVMHPAKFLLDQHSPLPSDVYNAAEFVSRAPRALDKNSLVILCSMTGTTKETTAAAEFARSKGAKTIGLTVEPASPLAKAVDHVVGFEAPYTTGVPIDARDSNYSRIYQIVMGLVALTGGEDLTGTLIGSLAALQPAIDRAHATFAPMFEDYAPRFAKEDVIYTVASGASYGAARTLPSQVPSLRRTPGPPPFAGMNSTPAASRAARSAWRTTGDVFGPLSLSARRTVARPTLARPASSSAVIFTNARPALIWAGVIRNVSFDCKLIVYLSRDTFFIT